MTRAKTWMVIGLVATGLAVGGCKPKPRPNTATDGGYNAAADSGGHKDYLKSQSSDAQRAMDSMPAPTGGQQ